jgi:preprotein translocase subunit SecD
MTSQSNREIESNKPKSLSKIILIVVGLFIVICGLVALLVFYRFMRLPSGPKSQIILEPEYSVVSTVDPADLQVDAEILTARADALGTRIKFAVAENNQIIAQVPTSSLSQNLIGQAIQIGLLEIVDFGETPIQPGTTIATDFSYKYFPQVEGKMWPTIITNVEFESVFVEKDKLGNYQIPFTLTSDGTKIFSDYTTKNVGHYLGIVLDKVVMSAPKVNSPITEGSGIIAGSFTQEEAESLAAYLNVKGPLPIPLTVKQISEMEK